MTTLAQEKTAFLVNGITVNIFSPYELGQGSRITAQLAVQQVAYLASNSIFSYSSDLFNLDALMLRWASADRPNCRGATPYIPLVDSRSGAGLVLMGFLTKAPKAPLSVVCSSGDVRNMVPVLHSSAELFRSQHIAIHAASVEYHVGLAKLIADPSPVVMAAQELGLPLLFSKVTDQADAQATAVLAHVLAKRTSVIHSYDGVRGCCHSQKPSLIDAEVLCKALSNLQEPRDVLHAFEITNQLLGSSLKPYEYTGRADADTVVVAFGQPAAAAASLGAEIGVVHVRLYAPFLKEEFFKVLPASVKKLVVTNPPTGLLPSTLFREISAAIKLKIGLAAAPRVIEIPAPLGAEITPSQLAEQLQLSPPKLALRVPTAVFWDRDNASTAGAAAGILNVLDGNLYASFDNDSAGGIVKVDLRIGSAQPWPLEAAQFTFVNDLTVLRFFDVVERADPNSILVVRVNDKALLDKTMLQAHRKKAALKNLKVYTVNYTTTGGLENQPQVNLLAAQAVYWTLMHPELSVDEITSKVMQGAGRDFELVAASVNNLVSEVQSNFLTQVDTNDWAEIEEVEEVNMGTNVVPTSFAPVAREKLDEGSPIHVQKMIDVAKRLVFPEAYNSTHELRPNLPVKNYIARVKKNQRVTPSDYDRNIFQLELDISGTGVKYAIGEALGIHAPNRARDVLDFIDFYKLNPDEILSVPHIDDPTVLEYKTVYSILRENVDLFGKVPKRFYEGLAEFAEDLEQRTRLLRLASPAGAEELHIRTEEEFLNHVDVLREFDSAHPPIAELVKLIAPLKRREYSIASSQKVHPNEVHLLVVVVDWVNKKGEKRFGQCSKYLSELQHGEEIVVSVKQSVMKLPKDPKTPIIMAGLGTGLAPFKAFLEEKMWQRDNGEEIGEIYLFLGSRHQRQEYLYGELFEAFKAAGILTHIGAAFSRDQPQKIYIQHRIREAKDQLIRAFVENNGNFYLCGPTWPVPDVSQALEDIVVTEAARRNAAVQADRIIEDLKDSERYILEVY